MGANPHANGGLLLQDLRLPDFRDYAVQRAAARRGRPRRRRACMGVFPARRDEAQSGGAQLPCRRPGRNRVQPPRRAVRSDRSHLAGRAAAGGRAPGAGRTRDGNPLRAHLSGLARRLPAHRPARAVLVLRGVHPHRRLDVQPARQVAQGVQRDSVAAADCLAQLPAHLARLAPGPQRLLAPGPGLHRPRGEQEGRHHPRVPAAGRQHPAVRHRPLPAQPQPRQRDRRRQADAAAMARHGCRHQALRVPASASWSGRATIRAANRTW